MAKNLVMNRDQLLALILDPEFYDACPEFVVLREQVVAANVGFAANKKCCGGKVKLMFPVLDATMALMHELQGSNPPALSRVRAFLCGKRKVAYDKVSIYYRKVREGFPDKLVFS